MKTKLTEDQKANAEEWRRAGKITFTLSRRQLQALKWFTDSTVCGYQLSPSEAAKEFVLHMIAIEPQERDPVASSAMMGAIFQAVDRNDDLHKRGFRSLSSYVDTRLRVSLPMWKQENKKLENETYYKSGEQASEG